MKTFFAKFAFASCFVFSFSSCQKDQEVQKTPDQPLLGETYVWLNGTDHVLLSSITPTDQQHWVPDWNDEVYVFESDDYLLDWADNDPSRQIFIDKMDQIAQERAWAETNGYLNDNEATDALAQQMVDDGQGGFGKDNSVLMFLFDNNTCGGDVMWLGLPFPSLLGMRNRGSSVGALGTGILCDNRWYGGRRVWVLTFAACLDLNWLNFSNRAESVLAF